MQTMYSAETEAEYASYASNLLLEATSRSPDWSRLVYDNPLSECTFRTYDPLAHGVGLGAGAGGRELTTPLFVETLASGSLAPASSSNGHYTRHSVTAAVGGLRQTIASQSLQFQPTQDIVAAGGGRMQQQQQQGKSRGTLQPFNWLTQTNNVDTFQTSVFDSLGATQSSLSSSGSNSGVLLFTSNRRPISSAAQAGADAAPQDQVDQSILRLRRRFMRDKMTSNNNMSSSVSRGNSSVEQANRFFAIKQAERKDKADEARKQMRMRRLTHVQSYRQYRIGDFPDIQIKHAELIAPLQALAQRDSHMAVALYSALFAAILDEADASFAASASASTTTTTSLALFKTATNNNQQQQQHRLELVDAKIEATLNAMLVSSSASTAAAADSTSFVKCVLEVALRHAARFRLDVAAIGTAALASMQQPVGILLLEEYIILNNIKRVNNNQQADNTTKKRHASGDTDAHTLKSFKRAKTNDDLTRG